MTESEQIVYISCVKQVRYSFVSHLSEALRRKGINDVFIDSDDFLSNESQSKVERARVSVVVLSGNSTVCLDKLVNVLECQRNIDQVVVPVLYGEIPLQVEWDKALNSRGLSSVHQSRNKCTDSELVEEITRDVYEKLFYMEGIGIYSKRLEIENIVCKQPFGVRSVGIWGMPGIGKTTLAKAVFDQMSGEFDASCFIEDFDKVIHEKGVYRLLEEHFLKEKPGTDSTITKLSLLSNKLNNKRVLIVLDDLRNPLIAEPLLGGFHWFGPESLIIITSRDKQVLRLCRVNQIYEVQGLNKKEALQLFLLSSSIKNKGEQNLKELSMKVIEYANGNPLALSIYGRELKGKKHLSEMERTFLKLKGHPPFKIVDAFKSSYESLNDREKNIFLDIACFFEGEKVDYVMQLLEGCGFLPHVGIYVLVEKCLVTISENRVWMHNLIQDVGRKIINKESVQIKRRSRLWKPGNIKYLLEDNIGKKENGEPKTTSKRAKGLEQIEGIFLDTSNISFDAEPSAFENMLNLRLLKIYCSNPDIYPVINFPNGSLRYLPNELRLLHWENYPLQSLPQSFDPRHLVEINMPNSQLQKLWGETKNLEMLKTVRLCHSQQLVDISDLWEAQHLEVIDLQGCTRLQSFPNTGQFLHLRVLNLSHCIEIKTFPEVPPNIKTLHLQGTGIIALPLSTTLEPNHTELLNFLTEDPGLSDALKLERLRSLLISSSYCQVLGKLIRLDLKDCSRLQSLPNMVNLEFLEVLELSGCSKLETIQGFPPNLKELYIARTAVRQVPQLPQSLELLNAHGCLSLELIRLDSAKLLMHYTFSNCFNLSPQVINDFLVKVLVNAQHIPRERQQELNESPDFSFCVPSHGNQYSKLDLQPGYSVMTRLNPSWRNTLVGFAMLVEVAFLEDYYDATGFGIRCVCRWKNKEGHSRRIERILHCRALGKVVEKNHMFFFIDFNMRPTTIWYDLVVFEFFSINRQTKRLDDSCTVTRCGVREITAATGDTSLENKLPVLFSQPMDFSGKEVEEGLRVSYDGLQEIYKALFLYIACLFNGEDVGLVTPLIVSIDLDVSSGLKVLADRSLISVSTNGEIVMHCLLRKMGKEILHTESLLPGSSKKIERSINAGKGEKRTCRDTFHLPTTSHMTASSLVATPTQHQVFISFMGEDIRKNFYDFLVHEMQDAGINVYRDEHEVRGMGLQNLLVRIEESAVAIVIFSEGYTTSEWCLKELVKINECAGNKTLMAIPVFYKLEASDVRDIEGDFGCHFRALKRKYPSDSVKVQKWEKAIASISGKIGMQLSAYGRISDRNFINSIIVEVKKSLEHIAKKANQRELRGAIQVQQSEAIQPQQPNANSQGCIFNVRQLKISGSHNPRYWTFESISESPNGEAIEVAKMKRCYYLEVSGKVDTRELTSGTRYEVVFVVKVEDTMSRWYNPATVQLMVPEMDLQERELQFVDQLKNEWIYIQAGVFEARPHKEKIAFYLYQHKSDVRMTGLLVKGAIVRPME